MRQLRTAAGGGMKTLRLFTDGASRGNPGPAGVGIVIEDDQGMRLWGGFRYLGTATNNKAEYLALIDGLQKVSEWSPDKLEVCMDSELVVKQLLGQYKVRDSELLRLHRQADKLLRGFPKFSVRHVPREKNRGADALANRAIDEGVS